MRTSPGTFLVLLLLAGCSRGEFTAVSTSSAGAFETSLAAFDDGFVAAWYDTRDGHPEIYVRALDVNGSPAGPEHRLTTTAGAAYEADIQPLRGDVVVGWYEKAPDGHLTPKLGAWTRGGTPLWSRTVSSTGRNTVVRAGAGLVFVAWIEDEASDRAGVWGAWWRTDGVALIPPRRLADAGTTTRNLNAAMDPDASPGNPHAWVVFDAKANTRSEELFLVEASERDSRVVQLTPDDGRSSKYPDLAFSGDRVAIAWFDTKDGNEEVYLAAGNRAVLTGAEHLQPVRVTSTPGHSIGAYLAWNGDRIGLAWCDDSDEGQQEIFFQPFSASGTSSGDAVRLTHTGEASLIPAIEAWKTGFALAWNEYDAPEGDGHAAGGRSQVVFRALP